MTIDQHNTGVSLNPYTTAKYHCAKTPLRQNSLSLVHYFICSGGKYSTINAQHSIHNGIPLNIEH